MKYIFLLLIFFTIESKARICYIVNESYTTKVSGFTPKGTIDPCPKDTDGKEVTEMLDITYLKNQTTACIDEADCYAKLENLCQDGFNNYGRPIVAGDFSEVYCTKPVFDAAKRAARLAAEQAIIDAEKAKEDKKRNDWQALCASAKAGIETLLCEERGF